MNDTIIEYKFGLRFGQKLKQNLSWFVSQKDSYESFCETMNDTIIEQKFGS